MTRHALLQKIHTYSSERSFNLLLVLSAVTAGIISLSIGLRQSVWFDEAYSILIAKQPVGDLLRLTALDTHPPLYYLLLKGWAGVFGWSELALRAASVGSMLLAIIVAGLLLRRMFSRRVAIGAILLLMVSPLVLRYGFEIRMYADAMLIGIAATYALYSAWQSKGRRRIAWLAGYAVLVAAGMFMLYYLAFLWIAHVAWLTYVHLRRKQSWQKLLPFAASYGGAVLLFLPWLPTFVSQISNGALAPIGQPLNLEQLIGVASFNIFYQPLYMLGVVSSVVMIAVAIVFGWAIPKARRELKGKADEIALLAAYIGVPIILLMIVSLSRSMYTERYLSHVAIGLVLLAGVIVTAAIRRNGFKKRGSVVAMVVLYGAFMLGALQLATVGNFNFQRLQTPTVKQAAASIATCAPGTKLLAADPYVATELSYYLPNCPTYFVSQWDTLRGGYAPFNASSYQIKDTNALSDARVTYVFYGTPDQLMPSKYLQASATTFGPLTVAEYKLSAE